MDEGEHCSGCGALRFRWFGGHHKCAVSGRVNDDEGYWAWRFTDAEHAAVFW